MSVETYLQALPKAELHLHLEGAIQPATALELAKRNNIKLPVNTVDEMNDWFRFRDFNHFVDIIVQVCSCLTTADDFELVTYDLAAQLKAQNVRYAEIDFSPAVHHLRGITQATYMEGLRRGRMRADSELGVTLNWTFAISRHRDRALADYVTEVAIDGRSDGVVALGLSGQEVGYPPEEFSEYFARARAAGLRSAPHAGELVGSESVWDALKALQADRIAHGVRAIEDALLVKHLADHGTGLAVSCTSNLCLGVYPDLSAHPLPALHSAGVQFTVNTDDPALFNTTLNHEIALLQSPLGFNISDIESIVLNGIRHSFLPDQKKLEMTAAYLSEMDSLRAVHLH